MVQAAQECHGCDLARAWPLAGIEDYRHALRDTPRPSITTQFIRPDPVRSGLGDWASGTGWCGREWL